jgi:hypothetical protein
MNYLLEYKQIADYLNWKNIDNYYITPFGNYKLEEFKFETDNNWQQEFIKNMNLDFGNMCIYYAEHNIILKTHDDYFKLIIDYVYGNFKTYLRK